MRKIENADCLSDITGEDILDSRDLEKLIDSLESEQSDAEIAREDYATDVKYYQEKMDEYRQACADEEDDPEEPEEPDKPEEFDADKAELLKALRELRDDTDGCGWRYGIAFISESHWQEYCEQFAEDVGYLPSGRGNDNPLWQCIDWEKWAEMMAQDYSTTEIDGETFYYRDA